MNEAAAHRTVIRLTLGRAGRDCFIHDVVAIDYVPNLAMPQRLDDLPIESFDALAIAAVKLLRPRFTAAAAGRQR